MRCPLKAGESTGEAYRQASESIIAWGAGMVPSGDNTAFRQHLENCADCQRVAEAQRVVWSELDAWTPTPVPSNFDERLYSRIGAYERQSWWSRSLANVRDSLNPNWSWKPAMPVAMACGALVAAFLLNSPEHGPQASVQSRVDGQPEMRMDLQQVELALDDLDMLRQLGIVYRRSSVPGRS